MAAGMSREISDLEPDTRAECEALLAAAAAVGIILLVTQTYRTIAEQDALYAMGRTRPGVPCHHLRSPFTRPVGSCSKHPMGATVTNAKGGQSWHNLRRAFDVAIVRFAGDTTPKNYYDGPWDQIGALGQALGLEWGGRWRKPDQPHFQDRGGMTLVQARRLT